MRVRPGRVIADTHRRHRSIELRTFLDLIEANVPDLDVPIIMDDYGAHETPLIHAWFAKRPRFHVHFTPTYGSWLNLVERWFAALTTKQRRRVVHRSVAELERAIHAFTVSWLSWVAPLVLTEVLLRLGDDRAQECPVSSPCGAAS